MTTRIVLAYSGSLASSAAVPWLLERQGAEVVTVTLDLGQADDLDEIRARALACGATRAHVLDSRDPFVRDCALPALRRGAASHLDRVADPLIARALVDVAALEAADALAHASADAALDACVAAIAPTARLVTPARTWGMDRDALADYVRRRGLPAASRRHERHLLLRAAVDPARAPATGAQVDLLFEDGVPVAINGVALTPTEVIDSLSLIAGQHGIGGDGETAAAPAAFVLRAAYAAAAGDAVVRLALRRGRVDVCGATTLDRRELNVSVHR